MTKPSKSSIRHQSSNRIDTFRDGGSPEEVHSVPETAVSAISADLSGPTGQLTGSSVRHYLAAVTTNVDSVIAAIDARRPGLSDTKRNLLLFFCQGHQLAHSGNALFAEALYATDRGVDLDDTGEQQTGEPLTPGELNTVADALDRYGDLSPSDLRTLVQASVPWQLAIKSTLGPRIEWAWLRDWFRRPEETNDPDDDRPTEARVAAWQNRRARR